MFNSLPSAWFAGVKIVLLTKEEATVSIPYKWFNKNPFNSMYFAILSMAAEVSTGVLCMGHSYKLQPSVSMLLVESNATFHKKATGKIFFTCADGIKILQTIEQAIATKEAAFVTCHSTGKNELDEIIAELNYTWSFKIRVPKTA